MWVNLHTGQRSPEFPVLSGLRDDVYRRANGWSDHQRAFKAFYDVTTLRQCIGDLPPSSVLRKRWRAARGRALARRPLTMLEVLYACEVLGIDAFDHPELVFLAEAALSLELPLGWEYVELTDQGILGSEPTRVATRPTEAAGFYRNTLLKQSQWQHPQLTYLVALAKAYVAADAGEGAESAV